MRIRPTRKRETSKARREREAYEAAIAEQRAAPRPGDLVAYDERIPLVPPVKLARSSDVETSHQAVPNADRRRTQLAAILTLYNADPRGLTADECSVLLGDDVWRRVSDLRTLGHLAWKLDDEGRPVTRTARSGRQARVLVRVMEAL